jgi:hypothetical protein
LLQRHTPSSYGTFRMLQSSDTHRIFGYATDVRDRCSGFIHAARKAFAPQGRRMKHLPMRRTCAAARVASPATPTLRGEPPPHTASPCAAGAHRAQRRRRPTPRRRPAPSPRAHPLSPRTCPPTTPDAEPLHARAPPRLRHLMQHRALTDLRPPRAALAVGSSLRAAEDLSGERTNE